MKLAITGGTGFVGSRLLDAAAQAGHEIRALTRRPMRPRVNVTWVQGSVDPPQSLDELVAGCEAVIHVAGVLKGRTVADFKGCNVGGTAAMLEAAKRTGVKRFVHVSSLAAREPQLSLYGASKAKSEELVAESGLSWAIVRPPAVYGPGDKEMLELFRMARLGLLLTPSRGRLSLIHADDLARLLLTIADPAARSGLIIEPDDGRPGGWSHAEFARAIARSVGRRSVRIPVPGALLRLAAHADQLIRRDGAKLTVDRAAYFAHPDWVADPAHAAPADVWQPRIDTEQGLKDTADWYRSDGWL